MRFLFIKVWSFLYSKLVLFRGILSRKSTKTHKIKIGKLIFHSFQPLRIFHKNLLSSKNVLFKTGTCMFLVANRENSLSLKLKSRAGRVIPNHTLNPPAPSIKSGQIGFWSKKKRNVLKPMKKTIFRFIIFRERVDFVLKILLYR